MDWKDLFLILVLAGLAVLVTGYGNYQLGIRDGRNQVCAQFQHDVNVGKLAPEVLDRGYCK